MAPEKQTTSTSRQTTTEDSAATTEPKVKIFWNLTNTDEYLMIPSGIKGFIHYDSTKLPVDKADPSFYPALKIMRSTLSRECTHGYIPIISLYLSFAVAAARKAFKVSQLTVNLSLIIPAVKVPVIGLVGGVLDFAVGPIAGKRDMGTAPSFHGQL